MTTQPLRGGGIGVRRRGFSLVTVALAAVVVTCEKNPSVRPVREIGTWHFTCQDGAVSIRQILRDSITDSVRGIPLSGPIANIPEYHDCQRFIDSSGSYDSVYAIFAAFHLDTLDSALASGLIPVGTIYTPDGTYGPLGIKPGFNCLILGKQGSLWSAVMVPRGQGQSAADCSGVSPAGGHPLVVRLEHVLHAALFKPSDYPPVARWDWDSVHTQQYIGIRCGGAWCEIGAQGFQPSAPYEGEPVSFEKPPGISWPLQATERVQRIKGWYDDQRLASDGPVQHPSVVRGRLIPSPLLDMVNWRQQHSALAVYKNSWVHVAVAIMDGDYGKWNLGRGLNKIFLCYGTAAPRSCPMPISAKQENPSSIELNSCPADPTDHTMRWWAKTESANGTTSYSCVQRMDHLAELMAWKALHPSTSSPASAGFIIPGAARWRFLLNDESTWVSCPTGCCSKN